MWKLTEKFDPDALGDQDRVRQDRRITLAIVLCLALGAVAALWAQWAKPSFQDITGAPLLTGAGQVTRVRYSQEVNEYGSAFHLRSLQVDGRELVAWDARLTGELNDGQRVRFTYRPGKSGRWYLQSIQPE